MCDVPREGLQGPIQRGCYRTTGERRKSAAMIGTNSTPRAALFLRFPAAVCGANNSLTRVGKDVGWTIDDTPRFSRGCAIGAIPLDCEDSLPRCAQLNRL